MYNKDFVHKEMKRHTYQDILINRIFLHILHVFMD
jgi:hypothetical protein